MKVFLRFLAGACLSLAMVTSANAHFLWIVTDPATSQTRVYFSEGAEPDDPDLLDRIADLKLSSFEPRDKVSEVAAERKDDALVAPLGNAYGVGLSRKYGVIERGGENFLLSYHATSQVSPLPSDWKRLGEQVPLEIVPDQKGNTVEFTVYWQGKPLSNAVIVVAGAGIEKAEGTTDAQGHFTTVLKKSGLLTVRAKHVENESGKFQDKAYDSVRHWTTLTVPVSVPTVQSLETSLPEVPKGITSFGGAVDGDWVYLYGGHWGGAHHYWQEGQSGEFLRLNVREPKGWEPLPGGPRRTGTAMVAYESKLYRVGGFEARNAEAEDADLHSMDDAQRFDPAAGKWESLPAMPVPRSSHDAAVLGDTLYVVGGWNIQKRGEGEFLDSMLTLDLKADKLEWKVSQVPFKRRALSVAAHKGKLYVMGGMQETGGATTRVDVYDPQSQTWSQGPALHGSSMEGFGNTAFEIGGKLTAITMSGAIQQLSSDGKSWALAGHLKHPRFFGRLLPISNNRGIVIAGAHMGSGKVTKTEVIGASDTVSQK